MQKRSTFRRFFIPLAAFLFPFFSSSYALEPISALDDGFAMPSFFTLAEAAYAWPGSEALSGGPFALLAWSAPFGVQDLAVTTAAAGGRFGRTGIFLSWSGTDFDLYGDDQEKIGISYLFAPKLAAGVRATRNALRIAGFGSASTWSGDAGLVYRPGEALTLAASVEDLAGAELGDSREPLDGRARVGLSWRIPGTATLLASMTKVRRFDPSFSAGILAEVAPAFLAGVLGANEPDRVEFLGALKVRSLRFSYRGSFHRDLGFTHGFSLGWSEFSTPGIISGTPGRASP
jgi:hypothetical protein